MYLLSLNVKNYRNIITTIFEPTSGTNILWGDNGQGKSNFLEIIYFIGTLKSFRGGNNSDFINKDKTTSIIQADIGNKYVSHTLNFTIYPTTKEILVDGKKIRNYRGFFSFLRPVIFSPEEVVVTKGQPALRRALLDRAIFQAGPDYLDKVRGYEYCLKQRNRALLERRPLQEIQPWTEGLIQKGALLRFERHRYLEKILPAFRETYYHIAGGHEQADICYPAGGDDYGQLEECLRMDLAAVHKRELLHGMTLAGPHRDEIEFSLNGQNIKNFGSQGQQRSCLLAFKSAQVMDIEKSTGETPILLLDDLNSELDRKRQEFYMDFLTARKGQVFITTTDPQPFVAHTLKNATVFQVVNGRITAENEMRKQ